MFWQDWKWFLWPNAFTPTLSQVVSDNGPDIRDQPLNHILFATFDRGKQRILANYCKNSLLPKEIPETVWINVVSCYFRKTTQFVKKAFGMLFQSLRVDPFVEFQGGHHIDVCTVYNALPIHHSHESHPKIQFYLFARH